MRITPGAAVVSLALSLALTFMCPACDDPAPPPEPPPPTVTVSRPVVRPIVEYREFSGRTVAVETVEVRARVSGYLREIHFKEGAEVAAGALLFEIDSRPYDMAVAQAEGKVAAEEARLKRLNTDLKRETALVQEGVTNQSTLDTIVGDRDEAAASLLALQAALARAKLDQEFTRVTSPIAGRVGRALLTEGNLVVADTTPLTNVVSLDPVYAYFDVDEGSALHYRKLVREKRVKSARDAEIPVHLALADERGYPHRGFIDFVDNHSDPTTGNIRVRGVFENADQVLLPGFYARVRVPFSDRYEALLVPEQALSMDQGGRFLLVVNANDVVERRSVEMTTTQEGMAVISRGVAAGDRVIVGGLQRARPGARVRPTPAAEDDVTKDAAPADTRGAEK